MNVGDLYLNLGIKGSERTVGSLASVQKGLGEVKSMSIEAKAAILGALYGLERLGAQSGAAGTGLTNFTALTGLSAQTLQQWQYAARQAGESGDDLLSSLKGVQNTVTNILLNKGAPEGLAILSKVVKDFDPKQMRDTFYVMGKLQEAAQKLPKDVAQTMLKSFGLSEGAIAAMQRNAFRPEVFAKAPTYSSGEIGQLDKANVAWKNLGATIEMAFGHFNAKHGVQLVNDITKITTAVIRLAEAIERIAEKWKIFDKLSSALNLGAEAIEAKPGTWAGETHYEKKAWEWFKGILTPEHKETPDQKLGAVKPIWDTSYRGVEPSAPAVPPAGSTTSNTVNQTVIFQNPDHAPKKTADSLKKAAGEFVKQNPAKVQGS